MISATVEEPETLPEPEMTAEEKAAEERKTGGRLADGTYRLPLDLSPGMKLRKENYNTKYHYQDPTIEMDTRDEKNGEYRYWIAEVKIQDASQLRTMPANSFTRSNNADGERLSHRAQAVLACNGDYWYRDVHWKGSYVLRQGQLYMHRLEGRTDLLLVNEDGDFRIIHDATEEITPLPAKEEGPVFYHDLNPRVFLFKDPDGHLPDGKAALCGNLHREGEHDPAGICGHAGRHGDSNRL